MAASRRCHATCPWWRSPVFPENAHTSEEIEMRRTLSIAAAPSVAAAFGSQAFAAPTPAVNPSRFGGHVQNAWFPLRPGTVYTYRGAKDPLPVKDVLIVTHATKVIQGVRCTVVNDRLYTRGRLIER